MLFWKLNTDRNMWATQFPLDLMQSFFLKYAITNLDQLEIYLCSRVDLWSQHCIDRTYSDTLTPYHMSRNVRKRTYGYVHPAKIQISSSCAFVQSSQNLHWAHLYICKEANFLHADNEDADQTAQVRRLIWAFAGCICQKVCFLTLWPTYVLKFQQVCFYHLSQ